MDFFILTYINQTQGIESGFTFGSFEDTPKIMMLDRILRTTGYIFSRRKFGQSIQSSYTNSALIREVIKKNQVTTIFQNGERIRAGKLNRQSFSDMAIRWIIDTYCRLNASIHESLVVVPVNISYDRIYESQNLAIEMINGVKQYYTVFNTLDKMWNLSKDSIGDIYVKYLEPINLHDYLQAQGPSKAELAGPAKSE